MFGRVGTSRLVVVQLQSLQRGRREEGARRTGTFASSLATLSALLQALPQPSRIAAIGEETLGRSAEAYGIDAAAHELD